MLKLARRIAAAALTVIAFERFLDWMFAAADQQAVEDMTWSEADNKAANDAYWDPR